jgi:pimeloyl-ACP methyl ester carboxylesterase
MIRRISFVWAVAAAAAVACAQQDRPAESSAEPPPEPTLREQAETIADTLLERAQSAGEAALAWLERRGANAEERLQRALSDALSRAEASQTLGVRLLETPKDPQKGAPTWAPLPERTPESLVLLVHGMDEPGGIWDDLAPALARAGHRVARFDYRNDQALAKSAEDLAAALADLRARGTKRIDIVAHSAGGLIARDVLTRTPAKSDAGAPAPMYAGAATGHKNLPDVPRLIMICTPNRGAALARFRAVTELREQFIRWIESDGRDPAALLGFLHDGSGEIAADLRPGSAYLEDLNARPLPSGVAITAVVGTVADTEEEELAAMLRWPIVRQILSEAEIKEAEEGIRELARVVGDGAVPVSSQVLEGVEDVVYLEANHRSILRRFGLPLVGGLGGTTEDGPPPAVGVVLERLGNKR